jgi:hypothetical protein
MFVRVWSDHGFVSSLKSRDGVPTTVNMQTRTAGMRSMMMWHKFRQAETSRPMRR